MTRFVHSDAFSFCVSDFVGPTGGLYWRVVGFKRFSTGNVFASLIYHYLWALVSGVGSVDGLRVWIFYSFNRLSFFCLFSFVAYWFEEFNMLPFIFFMVNLFTITKKKIKKILDLVFFVENKYFRFSFQLCLTFTLLGSYGFCFKKVDFASKGISYFSIIIINLRIGWLKNFLSIFHEQRKLTL